MVIFFFLIYFFKIDKIFCLIIGFKLFVVLFVINSFGWWVSVDVKLSFIIIFLENFFICFWDGKLNFWIKV